MSLRRAYVLLIGLNPDSALMRATNPDDWFWNVEHELLASVVELVDQHNRQYHAVNLKGTVPKPIEVRRPGQSTAARGTSLDELSSMFPSMTERPLTDETREG